MFNVVKSFAYWCAAAVVPSAFSQSADEAKTNPESKASRVDAFQGKPRVFVLSDIGNEPDDQMSLTRFLLYSNDYDIEGLVAATSTWQRKKVSPEIMQKVLSNYGKVRDNLLKHTPGFPAVEDLSKMVKAGQPA